VTVSRFAETSSPPKTTQGLNETRVSAGLSDCGAKEKVRARLDLARIERAKNGSIKRTQRSPPPDR